MRVVGNVPEFGQEMQGRGKLQRRLIVRSFQLDLLGWLHESCNFIITITLGVFVQATTIRDKTLGAVFGLAIGDALGVLFEELSGAAIQMAATEQKLELRNIGRRRIRKGDWADSTVQALAAAKSFNSCLGFEGVDLAMELVQQCRNNPRGIRPYVQDVVNQLAEDPEAWPNAGRDRWIQSGGAAAGNDALTRCLVVAIFFRDDLQKMINATIKTCQITHYDPRCVEAAICLNFVMIQCLKDRVGGDLIERTLSFLKAFRDSDQYFSDVLNFDPAAVAEHENYSPYPAYDQAKNAVRDSLEEISKIKRDHMRSSRGAVQTMEMAIWTLLHSNNYEEAAKFVVLLGGNSDTQGAVAGALAGARFGLGSIPREWTAAIKDGPTLQAQGELLMQQAQKILAKEIQSGIRGGTEEVPRLILD